MKIVAAAALIACHIRKGADIAMIKNSTPKLLLLLLLLLEAEMVKKVLLLLLLLMVVMVVYKSAKMCSIQAIVRV